MNTRKQSRRWADSEAKPASLTPPLPVQTTFRHMESSPAVAARIETEAQKLLRYFDRITGCQVVIVAPHRHHQRGLHYTVRVELGVPGDHIVIDHEPNFRPRTGERRPGRRTELGAAHKDLYVVIRDAFDSARRRLEDYARRVRGEIKRHPAADVT